MVSNWTTTNGPNKSECTCDDGVVSPYRQVLQRHAPHSTCPTLQTASQEMDTTINTLDSFANFHGSLTLKQMMPHLGAFSERKVTGVSRTWVVVDVVRGAAKTKLWASVVKSWLLTVDLTTTLPSTITFPWIDSRTHWLVDILHLFVA